MQEMNADRLRRRAMIARTALEAGVFCALAAVTVQSAVWMKENGAGPSMSVVEPLAFADVAAAPAAAPSQAAAAQDDTAGGPTMATRWDALDASIMPAPAASPSPAAHREAASAQAKPSAHPDSVRFYDGRPIRPVKTVWMTVTAYSPDWRSCGESADGITASTKSVWTNGMRMVAADTRVLPMGSLISVPGYASAEVVPVLDRGGAIKGKRLDVLYPTHEQARQWGVRRLPIVVWEYADGPAETKAKGKR